MEKQIILLNGSSSAGKSTLAKALQALIADKRKERYEIVSIDDFLEMTTDEVIYEEDVYEISGQLCEKVMQVLNANQGVIIDHVITSERIFEQLKEMLRSHRLWMVHVTCPLEIIQKREQERKDRCPGSAEASYTYLYPKEGYDLTVDTHFMTISECADRILERVLTMLVETERLIIRDLKLGDGEIFAEMALDGSLNDIGFDADCGAWMEQWIVEAKQFAVRNNPCKDYLAYVITLKNNEVIGSVGCSYYEELKEVGITYFIGAQYRNAGYATEAVQAYIEYFFNSYDVKRMIATVRAENVSSCKVVEKVGFLLTEKKMYKDINDSEEEMTHFYVIAS